MSDSNEKDMTETTLDRGDRKVREGYVVSDKMNKTVVVAVEDRFKHPLYGKVVRHQALACSRDPRARQVRLRVLVAEHDATYTHQVRRTCFDVYVAPPTI